MNELVKFSDWGEDCREQSLRALRSAWDDSFDGVFNQDYGLSLVEWAEKYRVLPTDVAESGRFRFDRTPYLRDIARALDSRDLSEQVVVNMKGSQLGFTDLGVNLVGKTVHQSPVPIMFVSETSEKMRRLMKTRVLPMLRGATFRGLLKQDSQSEVTFPGGSLTIWGSNSPSSFSSTSAAIVVLDEYARYKKSVGGEGDPFSLALSRISTYGVRGKIYIPSTPVHPDEDEGAFLSLYKLGDQKQFYMPCPDCGHKDYFRKERFHVEEDNGKIRGGMVCQNCGVIIREDSKPQMLAKGEWIPTAERQAENITSYHTPGTLAPVGWSSWNSIAQRLHNAQRGRTSLRPVMNTCFGIPFIEELEMPKFESIREKHCEERERGLVPDGVSFLTMAVDVQREFLFWEVAGWGKNLRRWSIDVGVIEHPITAIEGRNELSKLIGRLWKKESGATFAPEVVAIDSGDGATTTDVYKFVSRRPQPVLTPHGHVIQRARTVIAVKGGAQKDPKQLIERAQLIRKRAGLVRPMRVWILGTPIAKLEIYRAMSYERDDARAGRITFPAGYEDKVLEQIISEPIIADPHPRTGVVRISFGRPTKRNELLDVSVYQRAAAELFGISTMSDGAHDRLAARTVGAVSPLDGAPSDSKHYMSVQDARNLKKKRRAGTRADKESAKDSRKKRKTIRDM